MSKLSAAFNKEAIFDRIEGAAMGASAGFMFTLGNGAAAAAGGFLGFVLGANRLRDVFNAAVEGEHMAVALVPAAIRRIPRP